MLTNSMHVEGKLSKSCNSLCGWKRKARAKGEKGCTNMAIGTGQWKRKEFLQQSTLGLGDQNKNNKK